MEILNSFNYSFVTVYKIKKSEIDKIDFALCKQPTETLEAFYKRQTVKPTLLFNGGLFGLSNGNTYFTYRDENVTQSYMEQYTEGFGITTDGTFTAGNYGKDGKNYRDFICGYPVLIKGGKAYVSNTGKELDRKTRRTVLAYDTSYIYVVIVEEPGLNFTQLKTVLQNLGVKEAINLDGGGSTRLLYNGTRKSANIASRAVDNVVAIYFKQATNAQTNSGKTVTITPYVLQKGDKGSAVKALQRCLKGYSGNSDPGEIDGDFGTKTYTAVKVVQTANNLEATGIADEKFWKIITGI